jgi:hypothetical protein
MSDTNFEDIYIEEYMSGCRTSQILIYKNNKIFMGNQTRTLGSDPILHIFQKYSMPLHYKPKINQTLFELFPFSKSHAN